MSGRFCSIARATEAFHHYQPVSHRQGTPRALGGRMQGIAGPFLACFTVTGAFRSGVSSNPFTRLGTKMSAAYGGMTSRRLFGRGFRNVTGGFRPSWITKSPRGTPRATDGRSQLFGRNATGGFHRQLVSHRRGTPRTAVGRRVQGFFSIARCNGRFRFFGQRCFAPSGYASSSTRVMSGLLY